MNMPTELSYWALGLLIVQSLKWSFDMIRAVWEQKEFDRGEIPKRWKKKMKGVEEFHFCCTGPWGLGLTDRVLSRSHLIHEWAHVYTAAPWIISFCGTFGWLLWYEQHGLIWALVINWFAAKIFIQMPFEAVADLASVAAFGPKQFVRDTGKLYRVTTKRLKKLFGRGRLSDIVIAINILNEMICYPLWRLPLHIYGNYLERQAYITHQEKRTHRNAVWRISNEIEKKEDLLGRARDDVVIDHLLREIGELVLQKEDLIRSRQDLVAADARSIYDIC